MNKEEILKVEELAKPLIDWLYENGTPHTQIVIEMTSIVVYDGRIGIPIEPRD